MELDAGRRARMHNSDCLAGMSRIETGTVDLVLTEERRLEGPSAL